MRRASAAEEKRVREVQSALEAFGRAASPANAVAALTALGELTSEEREALGAIHRYENVIAQLTALVPPGEDLIPDGWMPWAAGIRIAPGWTGASALLDLAADSWAIDPLLERERAEEFAMTVMDARSDGGRDAAARALDYVVPAAEAAVSRGSDATYLGSHLITVLLAHDVVTDADWTFVVGLLDVVLDGIDVARYREILDEVRSTLTARASPATIDPAIAALEVAAFHPVPDRVALRGLAAVVIGICDRFVHRLHRDQLSIVQMACNDLGEGFEEQARDLATRAQSTTDEPSGSANLLDGQVVGIYSLEQAAASRAKVAIEAAYDGVRVDTDASHVSTQALRRLAQTADQMIVATRAAKHAATTEVEAILRKRHVRPIFPAGKGATSIVRALRERLVEV
jgi:hypothetical protein